MLRFYAVTITVFALLMLWSAADSKPSYPDAPPEGEVSAAGSTALMLDDFFVQQYSESGRPQTVADDDRSPSEQRDALTACFYATQKHMTAHTERYTEEAQKAAKLKGMRMDDALRLFFHGSLVACYHNIEEADIAGHKARTLGNDDMVRLLWRNEKTPFSIPESAMDILSDIVKEYQASAETPDVMGLRGLSEIMSGPIGYVYTAIIFLVVGGLLYAISIRMQNLEIERKKKPVLAKETKKEKKRK